MKHQVISILCLLAPLAAAQDAGNPVIPLGSTRVATSRGIMMIDKRPLPAPAAEAAVPRAQRQGPLPADEPIPAPPLADTFLLHSRPTATKVIYLDFDGHVGLEPGGTYPPFNFEGDASTFSDAERTRIQEVWRSVAEDFMPFDVDVTTQQPPIEDLKKTGGSDTRWGIRCVIAPGPWDYSWGYTGSFNWDRDYECQAYTGDYSWIWIADSISHEVGHTLGLDEHGQQPGDGTYYEGHGSGNTHWAPIMGWTKMSTPYGLSQWDKGEYLNADHSEDALNIITTQNGFGYRPDDHGSTTGTATPVSLPATPAVVAEGVIEQRTDVDYFSFTLTGPGTVSLVINGDVYPSDASHRSSNLDVLAKIHNAAGTVLHTSNPAAEIHASFTNVALAAGTYYLSIDGTGLSTPTDGYSDYGSLGYYSITASIAGGTAPPSIGGYNVYYGQLHSHTTLSDGSGTPAQAYAYARDTAKLDFFSIADHCSYPYNGMMTVAEYQALQTTANSYHQDGTFVTFWGFEWTSDDTSWGGPSTLLGKGHLTIINSPDFCRATDEASNDLNELVNWMSARDVVAFFNHPGEYGTTFDNFNFNSTDKIVGMELWNRSTDYYGTGTWFHNALNKGWYLGAEGSGDNHSADWGTQNEWRMAVLAASLTRATLFDAMKARRFFSSRDKNLALSFKCNGAEMGSRIPAGALNIQIEATDGDNETFTRVELVKNGTIVNTWTPNNTHPLVTTSTTGAAGDSFYAKVFQGASWTAISSPVFIIQSTASSNANLSNLVPSAGTLTPAFASGTTSYTASVPYATSSMTVTPTKADAGATIKVNGTTVASGSPAGPISLNVGANTITTVVTAQDGTTTKTYTLTVTRAADTTAPSVVTLSPADNAPTAPITTNLVVTFNESIAIGTGNITIKNLTDMTQATISITDATQVSVAGAVLTINPTADLVPGKTYAIRIEPGAIKDLANNPFGGITDEVTWNFATSIDVILYQDNFDNDTLATNAGTGGGLGRYSRQGDTWVDNGQLSGNSTGGNDRGNVYSLNSFLLTGGFKLEVNYSIGDVSNINANRVIIGLLDQIPSPQTNTTYVTQFLAANQDRYGIGLNMTTDTGTQGLNYANDAGAGSVTSLSNAQTIAVGTHTWVLEMGTTGNWSYSIDGATPTTGTIAGGFDPTRDYHFFAFVQDYRNNQFKVNSVTLSVVSEPSTGFDSWKTKNGATGTLANDHDNDGVSNGVEYFLVGPNGNSTGFTALPGVSNTGGVLSVTWTKAADYAGVYPTDFVVETSESLTGTWTPEASPGNVTITGNQVKYTFPSPLGSKKFARLKVTGP